MSKTRNIWFTISLVSTSALILTSALSFYYYSQYLGAEKRYADTLSSLNHISYRVNIMVRYDNGTRIWYNRTTVPIGYSLFNATLEATGAKVEAKWYSWGVFVTSINGVEADMSKFWLWFSWDKATNRWNMGETGSENYIMKQDDIACWFLTDGTTTP